MKKIIVLIHRPAKLYKFSLIAQTIPALLIPACLAAELPIPIMPDWNAWPVTHSITLVTPIKNWKTLRDSRIVKQSLDYSCGAASLATLLNEYYGQRVTEQAILIAMAKGNGRASFEDMALVLPQFGFKAQGFTASWKQLIKLRIPVIVYLKYRKTDHFSLVRGIGANTIWLADSSLGNRTYSREQFLPMWTSHSGDEKHAQLRGKFLAVLPALADISAQSDFFDSAPARQTKSAVLQQAFRPVP